MEILLLGIKSADRVRVYDAFNKAFAKNPASIVVKATKKRIRIVYVRITVPPGEKLDENFVKGKVDAILTRTGYRICSVRIRAKAQPPRKSFDMTGLAWNIE